MRQWTHTGDSPLLSKLYNAGTGKFLPTVHNPVTEVKNPWLRDMRQLVPRHTAHPKGLGLKCFSFLRNSGEEPTTGWEHPFCPLTHGWQIQERSACVSLRFLTVE